MNYGFPDWMFAAIAIAAWELSEYLARRFHLAHVRLGAYIVIAICVVWVGIRYIARFIERRKHPHEHDPEEWKKY